MSGFFEKFTAEAFLRFQGAALAAIDTECAVSDDGNGAIIEAERATTRIAKAAVASLSLEQVLSTASFSCIPVLKEPSYTGGRREVWVGASLVGAIFEQERKFVWRLFVTDKTGSAVEGEEKTLELALAGIRGEWFNFMGRLIGEAPDREGGL